MAKSLLNGPEFQFDLLSKILENKEGIVDTELILESYCQFLLLEGIKEPEVVFDEYLTLIKKFNKTLTQEDALVFIKFINIHFSNEKYNLALTLCNFLENKIVKMSDIPSIEYALLYYWKANILNYTNRKHQSAFYANKALSILHNPNAVNANVVNASGLQRVKGEMQSIINATYSNKYFAINENNSDTGNNLQSYYEKPNEPRRSEIVKVKYLNGKNIVKTGKYKFFEKDIKSGKCKIVS